LAKLANFNVDSIESPPIDGGRRYIQFTPVGEQVSVTPRCAEIFAVQVLGKTDIIRGSMPNLEKFVM
jgi:hypothetical protein